jgi:hypothetical protein
MRPKSIATIVLLLFVAASIAVLAIKGLRSGPQAAEAKPPLSDGLIVYYFHGKVRCPTCESIEAYAREAVEGGFAEQLHNGRLRWRVVNYEQPGNEHFTTDYQLVAPTVVLVDIRGGVQRNWKNLPEVWEFVGDKPAFIKFVQKEVQGFLDGSGNQ